MPLKMPSGDRGSYSILFIAFLLGVCGVGVFVVDAGRVYVEGRQVQNGAQAAALRIAETCAAGPCSTTAGDALANGNALDGATQVEPPVCGTAPGLPGCTSDGVRPRFGCAPVSGTASYVQVRTRTRDAAGGSVLPGLFSRVSDPGAGSSVRACARAAYGNPGGLTGQLPLAMSTCEFDYWRNLHGLTNAPHPPAAEAILYFHDTGGGGPSNCPDRSTSNSNPDTPGGFGWLATTSSCEIATTVDGDGVEKPGNSVPGGCDADDFFNMLGTVVNVPIYGTVTNNVYDIVGYAAFRLTGYRLSGSPAYRQPSPTLSGPPYSLSLSNNPCPSSSRCISGFFTNDVVTSSGPLVPGPSLGSVTVRLVG
jgi:hypothetical protein